MAFEKELALVQRWVDETDQIALEHFKVGALTEIKPDGTPVTVGDRMVERTLRRHIGEHFGADAILGEEEGESTPGAERRWVVDPIDATKNYMRGIPVFATLVALEVEGESVLGLVSAPGLGARWWATRGGGAYASGARVRVSATDTLDQADVITGGDDWALGAGDGYKRLLTDARRHRAFGDFWGHMMVAQGSAEVMVEHAPLARWDIAAPRIIVQEAGGRVTDFAGQDARAGGQVVSSNSLIHDEVLAALA